MQLRGRTAAPVIGGVAAAATAVGAFVPATQVAVAAPDVEAGATTPLGLAQDGAFESCSAYFGIGKGAGDVTDAEGEDDGDHEVGGDVELVVVLEDVDGNTIRCRPEVLTEDGWDAFLTSWEDEVGPIGFPSPGAWPGPGRYVFPSTGWNLDIDGFGDLASVGFEVIGLPDEHSLRSPVGVRALANPYAAILQVLDSDGLPDSTAALEIIDARAGSAAAAAYEAAREMCAPGEPVSLPADPDLLDAIFALVEHAGVELPPEVEEDPEILISCGLFWTAPILAAYPAMLDSLATYTEAIVLAGPVQEPTPPEPTAPGGAQPVTATPTSTG